MVGQLRLWFHKLGSSGSWPARKGGNHLLPCVFLLHETTEAGVMLALLMLSIFPFSPVFWFKEVCESWKNMQSSNFPGYCHNSPSLPEHLLKSACICFSLVWSVTADSRTVCIMCVWIYCLKLRTYTEYPHKHPFTHIPPCLPDIFFEPHLIHKRLASAGVWGSQAHIRHEREGPLWSPKMSELVCM